MQRFIQKSKKLNLRPKIPYVGTFEFVKLSSFIQNKTKLGIFGLEFEKNIVIFEIKTLKFV